MARPQRKTNWTILTFAGLLAVLVAIGGLISKHVPAAYMVGLMEFSGVSGPYEGPMQSSQ